MKQINPLYIVLLLTVLLAFVLLGLLDAKSALHETQNRFDATKGMVHDLVDLRRNWDDKQRTRNSVKRILKASALRKSEVVYKEKRGMISLKGESMDSSSASYLLNRLMNEPFTINSLQIRRLNKERASMYVEIAL